jgi:hypothetical protein
VRTEEQNMGQFTDGFAALAILGVIFNQTSGASYPPTYSLFHFSHFF